jgi:tryptophan synthase alpha chain
MTAATTFEKSKTLVGYLPAGFPDKATAIAGAVAMAEAGAGVIEIGLPSSDPLMDGPVIADAVHQARTGGTRIKDVLDTVEAVAATGAQVLIMTYWNPVDHYGVHRFAADLANAGGAGLITPDLTPEEAGDWLAASDEHGLDRVFLVAPSSTEERIKSITAVCRGFVYAASLMGTTGTRDAVSGDAAGLVARTKNYTTLPVAVGLGVKDRAQAREVAQFADGVIVGTAFVRALSGPGGVDAVRALAADLAQGVTEAR